MRLQLPEFASKIQLFNYLQKNADRLNALKKSEMKKADAVDYTSPELFVPGKAGEMAKALKEEEPVDTSVTVLRVKSIINTTNLIDGHMDMHVPKMWNKSLKETTYHMLIKEHNMSFDDIIADGDDVQASAETYEWKALGAKYKGETEALVFLSQVRKDQHEFMFKKYAQKKVRNHSVGMRYGKLVMCIGNKDFGAEFEAWEKYLPMAVNPEVAEEKGYFWAVPEGKVIEGSAVPRGSNWVTPTLDKTLVVEPGNHSTKDDNEPVLPLIDFGYLSKHF